MTNEPKFTMRECDTCHSVQEIREGCTTCFRCRNSPPPKTIEQSIAETQAACPVGTRIVATETYMTARGEKTTTIRGVVRRHNPTTMTVRWDGAAKDSRVHYPAFVQRRGGSLTIEKE